MQLFFLSLCLHLCLTHIIKNSFIASFPAEELTEAGILLVIDGVVIVFVVMFDGSRYFVWLLMGWWLCLSRQIQGYLEKAVSLLRGENNVLAHHPNASIYKSVCLWHYDHASLWLFFCCCFFKHGSFIALTLSLPCLLHHHTENDQ